MTIVNIPKKELEKKIGRISKEVEEKIAMFGTTVEESTDDILAIEVYPNRPDLLSTQGFVRAMDNYLLCKKIKEYRVKKPEKNFRVKIEKAVKEVRPFTVCAIVKNLKFTDARIKEIIDIQEKLHLTIGRKRKKLAIGIYPLEKITLPITFTAKKPEEIKFRPLEANEEMTGRQILSRHPAGREYACLLKDKELFPVFIDGENRVLSMPPIINSHETGKISGSTSEIFIECSGFNLYYLKKTMNIIASALADMGGEIYAMEIEDKEKTISPILDPERVEFRIEDLNKTLGLQLKEKDLPRLLQKMGIGCELKGKKSFALVPAYRTDILHWIDLAEEVGIAYGYENFIPEIPKISTIAQEDPTSVKKRLLANILSGLGLLEASSYLLSTKEDIKKAVPDFKDFIEVEESKTEFNVLRPNLLANLMKIISENTDVSYPQKIFEIGKTLSLADTETGIREDEKLGIAIAGETANFTEIKQILDYLFKMLNKTYELRDTEHPTFISGRAGKIVVDGKEIGVIGEIHPKIISNLKVKMPISALEINLV
jgi:phenylalanyl-tRNA synthetase beta chain